MSSVSLQSASTARRVVRVSLAVLTAGTTVAATIAYASLLWTERVHVLDPLLVLLFVTLLVFISFTFWMATFGFVQQLRRNLRPRRGETEPAAHGDARPEESLPRTAIVMPVYNEDPARGFAGLHALHEALQELGWGERFDIFLLSDTTDPEVWLEEELAWASLRASVSGGSGLYYRRRPRNTGRKSGNVTDFLERWGDGYVYLVILDADSMMTAETLVELVQRMEADPQIGILQAPPVPVNRSSFFARSQEFAASVYGQAFTAGVAMWSQEASNYWGHNAIIRVRPFIEHCGLPKLPGTAPLGGEILSHDFVEAALMRRAGWKVVLADDLGGSYEECPTNLIDYAKRNRRWCEGNLQHLRLLLVDGFHPISRIHFGVGAMAYLSSAVWLLFLLISFARSASMQLASGVVLTPFAAPHIAPYGYRALALFIGTMALLLVPKLWGYILLLTGDRDRLAAHGGAIRAGLSMLLETVISVLIAPILMAFNVVFILSALTGHAVSWTAQQRSERLERLKEAARTYWGLTVVGTVAVLAIGIITPGLFWWMLPVLIGYVLAIPVSMMLSSVVVGQRLRAWGLLLIQAESAPPPLLRRQQQFLTEAPRCPTLDRFTHVVVDPVFNLLHISILRATGAGIEHDERMEQLQRSALHDGPARLTREDRLALLADEKALRWLHRQAWLHWPPEWLDEVARVSLCMQSTQPEPLRGAT